MSLWVSQQAASFMVSADLTVKWILQLEVIMCMVARTPGFSLLLSWLPRVMDCDWKSKLHKPFPLLSCLLSVFITETEINKNSLPLLLANSVPRPSPWRCSSSTRASILLLVSCLYFIRHCWISSESILHLCPAPKCPRRLLSILLIVIFFVWTYLKRVRLEILIFVWFPPLLLYLERSLATSKERNAISQFLPMASFFLFNSLIFL